MASAARISFKMNNGRWIPALGLGTYNTKGYDNVLATLKAAVVDNKYKLIDTGGAFGNEKDISRALKELGVKREKVFIASKLAMTHQGKAMASKAIESSLRDLDTDYIDLYQIHWPGAMKVKPKDPKNAQLRRESWDVLAEYQSKGVLKSIGVCNYLASHLNELMQNSTALPQVNQMEFHPFYQQQDTLDLCKERGIHITAYSSLGSVPKPGKTSELLANPVVQEVAAESQATPAQVLLKYALDRGYSVIPKSSNPDHIRLNAQSNSVKISDESRRKLDSLACNKKFTWNPIVVA